MTNLHLNLNKNYKLLDDQGGFKVPIEIGAYHDIQGFDLNYAGVILGPSVKYRNGEVVFDPSASYNTKAVRNRTLSDGSKQKFGEELIQHEVRVLMTRGVEGLYIYACDDALREALLQAMK